MSTVKVYLLAAFVVATMAALGLIYAKGRLDAKHAAELASLQRTLQEREADIKKLEAAAEHERKVRIADAIQAKLDAEDAALREAKITELEEYAQGLADRDAECLSGADVDRLWKSLWD